MVAGALVVAAVVEAVARDVGHVGKLAADVSAAVVLLVLAVRRTRPRTVLAVLSGVAVVSIVSTQMLWPEVSDEGGVWLFAVMLAAYSVGAYRRGPSVLLGFLLPLIIVVVADLPSGGWSRLGGVLFVTVFVGALPTAAGRAVGARRDRLVMLRERHRQILEAQRARRESAVLTERLRASERVQRTLIADVRTLADGEAEPGVVEAKARDLLARTREEVLMLTAAAEPADAEEPRAPHHLPTLRARAQPWAVLGGAAVALGLSTEVASTPGGPAPSWAAALGVLLVGLPLSFVWWRPLVAVVLAWAATSAYSHLIVPLDGTVSEAAVAFGTAFAVGALCRQPWAAVGLAVCWVGQILGVGGTGRFGESTFILLSWLAGMAVQEASRLVEETRATTRRLEEQENAVAERALVQERMRLAREVHDSIGHTLTVIALQAGAARRLATTDPMRSSEVMRTVRDVARHGITEDTDLAALLRRVRSTGLAVDADLAGLSDLAPEQREAAYHVVREALTNVMRYAPGARVAVRVGRCATGAEVTIDNSQGQWPGTGHGTGRGLTGIRERVAARGGDVTWGPTGAGGFRVCALVPDSGPTSSRPVLSADVDVAP